MAEAMQTLQPSINASLKIKTALTQMAILRGARLDPSTLKLYSLRLEREHTEDVIEACERLQDMPREEGELALPEIGAILSLVKVASVARESRKLANHDRLSRWECPNCKATAAGYIKADDGRPRECGGCHHLMQQTELRRCSGGAA